MFFALLESMFDKLNILLAALLQQYVATVRLPMFFSLRRIYSYQNMVTPSPDVAAVPLTTDWFLYCSDICHRLTTLPLSALSDTQRGRLGVELSCHSFRSVVNTTLVYLKRLIDRVS